MNTNTNKGDTMKDFNELTEQLLNEGGLVTEDTVLELMRRIEELEQRLDVYEANVIPPNVLL